MLAIRAKLCPAQVLRDSFTVRLRFKRWSEATFQPLLFSPVEASDLESVHHRQGDHMSRLGWYPEIELVYKGSW